MLDLRDLYQEVILDHNKQPRNFHTMTDASHEAEGYNPLCGDQLTLFLKIDANDIIQEISFKGCGCAISTASASLMTENLKGKTAAEAEKLFANVHTMLTQDNASSEQLGKLAVLSGVKAYPARVKCATLAWHTLEAALNNSKDVVVTE